MATLIKNKHIATDNWQLLDAAAGAVPAGDVIFPYAVWAEQRAQLRARRAFAVGVE